MAHIAIDARIIRSTTGRYVERLLTHLQAIDRENQYIVLLLREDFERWHPAAPNFSKCIADYRPYGIRAQVQFALQLYRSRIDLVHFTTPERPVFYRRRYVATVHDLTLVDFVNRRREGLLRDWYKQSVKPKVFRWLLRDTVRSAICVIVPSDHVRGQLIQRFRAEESRVRRTYEAADLLAAQPSAIPHLAGQSFILYVGTASPYKNLARLIDATAPLKSFKLVLVGKPGYFHRQLRDHVEKHGYTNIDFVGFVSDAELAWLYQNAQLYVCPSLSEGFGLPGLEAMAHGLPVASSNAGCLPEVYGDAAVYFDPKTTEDMARALEETLTSQEKLAQLRIAGLARAQQFSWKRMAEQTLEVYEDALKR